MKLFNLPDLGEGLSEAEIREWYVARGASLKAGEPMVAVETAKAIVEIPAPWDGTVAKLFAAPGDIHPVGAPLAGFEDGDATAPPAPARADSGTVVGEVKSGGGTVREAPAPIAAGGAGFKVMPAVRALARRLDVDLGVVTPSGPDGLITAADVERVARVLAEAGPLEPLRGPRRAMARAMAQAHAEVADVTVTEDADIGAWYPGGDVTLRLIRAVVAAGRAKPALNVWSDPHALGRGVLQRVDLGIAVDTPDGLFVPVLRDVANRAEVDLRAGLERLKADVRARRIPAEELRGYSIILSNYGAIGGRYSDPVVMPPTVAILGARRVRDQVLAVDGKPLVRPVMPLSLTVDHRVVTGGEATRFLMAVVPDLQGG